MAWIENQFGDVLLLKQSRGRRLWTLPGGKVRQRESLLAAIRREVLEETGLKVQGLSMCGVFDRPRKATITFLYAAKIRGRKDTVYPKSSEIETAKYSAVLVKNATPSLMHFWAHMRSE